MSARRRVKDNPEVERPTFAMETENAWPGFCMRTTVGLLGAGVVGAIGAPASWFQPSALYTRTVTLPPTQRSLLIKKENV